MLDQNEKKTQTSAETKSKVVAPTKKKVTKHNFTVRKEMYKEMACRLFLQKLTYVEISAKIYKDTMHKVSPGTVATYVREATKAWTANLPEWSSNVTVQELEQINRIEAEAWLAYERSCRPIKTIKRKFVPVEDFIVEENPAPTKKKTKVVIQVKKLKLLEELHEEREAIPDVKFLLLMESCSKRRIEILGHSAAPKPEVKKKGESDPEGDKPLQQGQRRITFQRSGTTNTIELNNPVENAE